MKRALILIVSTLLSMAVVVSTPAVAEAKKKNRDTPGCVSKAEYRAARTGMSQSDVRNLFDIPGRVRFYNDHGSWSGDWVDSGHWVNDGFWVEDGHFEPQYDEFGNIVGEVWVDDSYWQDASYWQDTSYWDDTATWDSSIDIVRTYKKCRSFNRGRGRVAINFDDYSRDWLAGPRLAFKNPSNPGFMDVAAYFRLGTGTTLAGKELPRPRTQANTPKPTAPNSPKPAPRPIGPKPTA